MRLTNEVIDSVKEEEQKARVPWEGGGGRGGCKYIDILLLLRTPFFDHTLVIVMVCL